MSAALATYQPIDGNLSQWIASRIKEGCNRIALRQRAEDGTAQRVREWPMTPQTDANELAEAVQRRAWEDGRHFGARALYGVFAYRDHVQVDRTFLTIESDDGSEGMALAPVPPRLRDIAVEQLAAVSGQLMRHNEANMRVAIGQTVDIIGHYKDMLAARDRRIEDLERRNTEVATLYEKMTTLQHEREIEVMREERENRNHDFLREKLDLALPILLSKLARHANGSAAPAANTNASSKNGEGAAEEATSSSSGESSVDHIYKEELLSKLLGSLSKVQIAKIAEVLTPEQQMAIHELYIAYGKRDLEKQAARKAKTESSSSRSRKKGGTAPKEGIQ